VGWRNGIAADAADRAKAIRPAGTLLNLENLRKTKQMPTGDIVGHVIGAGS
jgi:hypothetical protein